MEDDEFFLVSVAEVQAGSHDWQDIIFILSLLFSIRVRLRVFERSERQFMGSAEKPKLRSDGPNYRISKRPHAADVRRFLWSL